MITSFSELPIATGDSALLQRIAVITVFCPTELPVNGTLDIIVPFLMSIKPGGTSVGNSKLTFPAAPVVFDMPFKSTLAPDTGTPLLSVTIMSTTDLFFIKFVFANIGRIGVFLKKLDTSSALKSPDSILLTNFSYEFISIVIITHHLVSYAGLFTPHVSRWSKCHRAITARLYYKVYFSCHALPYIVYRCCGP